MTHVAEGEGNAIGRGECITAIRIQIQWLGWLNMEDIGPEE